MRRISTATRVIDKFGVGKPGFTNGNAVSGIPATDLEDVWFDHVQEEIANVIEGMGTTLDPNDRTQLKTALKGRLLNVQVFFANGTYTPTPGTVTAIVEGIGGGGAGGGVTAGGAGTAGAGGGGGAGSWGVKRWLAPSTQTVTIGAGGTSVTNGAGVAGGTTSLGSVCTFPGGNGGGLGTSTGAAGVTGSGATIGSGTTGADYGTQGQQGTPGIALSASSALSGAGAQTRFGAGGIAGGANGTNSTPGNGATGYGAGGAGALAVNAGANQGGGVGFKGILIIYEYA